MSNLFLLLAKGFIIGLAVAAPVGPMCVLCLQRTLSHGRHSGFLTGFGIATADVIYAILAILGLSKVGYLLSGHETTLRIWGSVVVLFLGFKVALTPPKTATVKQNHKTLLTDFFSGFLLALLNPMVLVFFIGVFASLDLFNRPWLMLIGLYLGSTFWWFGITLGMQQLKRRIKSLPLRTINRVSGTIIVVFGGIALISSFF